VLVYTYGYAKSAIAAKHLCPSKRARGIQYIVRFSLHASISSCNYHTFEWISCECRKAVGVRTCSLFEQRTEK
jgi:hypothetical protein